MTFRNSILAGVTLIREAIQSQNYQAGADGWTINADGTAEFADLTIRSSDGSGATVEIENGKAIFTAANGWKIIIDPTNVLPIIYFLDGDGDEAGAINATGDNTRAGLNISSGPFTDGPVTDWRWVLFQGETSAGDRALITRVRDSDPDIFLGGWLFVDADTAQLAVVDSEDPTFNTLLQVEDHVFIVDDARTLISPTASAFPAVFLNITAAGHTGSLLHLQREGVGYFSVDNVGNATAAGDIEALGDLVGDNVDAAGDVTAGGSVAADNIRHGSASTPAPGAGGGTSTVNVVFANAMPNTPRVTIDPVTTVDPATVTIRGYVDNVTTAGFTIRAFRSTNSATTWAYNALCT